MCFASVNQKLPSELIISSLIIISIHISIYSSYVSCSKMYIDSTSFQLPKCQTQNIRDKLPVSPNFLFHHSAFCLPVGATATHRPFAYLLHGDPEFGSQPPLCCSPHPNRIGLLHLTECMKGVTTASVGKATYSRKRGLNTTMPGRPWKIRRPLSVRWNRSSWAQATVQLGIQTPKAERWTEGSLQGIKTNAYVPFF